MKRALVIVAIVVAGLAATSVRVVVEGRAAIADGDAALAAKRPLDAIAGWERAARWYLPLAPHVDDAYARLRELATADATLALPAWRAVRRAALATTTLWTPHASDLAAANAAIATASAKHPDAAPAAGADEAARTAFYAARLAADQRPTRAAAALAVIGIFAWLAGIAVLARGVDAAGRLLRRRAAVGAGLAVAGLAAWAIGLYVA